jgi:hypothetical protein
MIAFAYPTCNLSAVQLRSKSAVSPVNNGELDLRSMNLTTLETIVAIEGIR